MRHLVVICVFVKFIFVSSDTLPEDFPEPCHRSDPHYNECVLRAINETAHYIIKGVPEYNIPKFDPLEMPTISVNRSINDFLSVTSELKNIKIYGFAKTHIDDLKTNLANLSLEIRYTHPYIHLDMDYNVSGQLLTIPLQSQGQFRGNFSDVTTHVKVTCKLIERDGTKYFTLDKLKVKARVGDGFVKLFAKDPVDQYAADLITTFFNQNPKRTLDAMNPFYEATLKEAYNFTLKQAFSIIPAEELLPE